MTDSAPRIYPDPPRRLCVWTGRGCLQDWGDPRNWSDSKIPTTGDTIRFHLFDLKERQE